MAAWRSRSGTGPCSLRLRLLGRLPRLAGRFLVLALLAVLLLLLRLLTVLGLLAVGLLLLAVLLLVTWVPRPRDLGDADL